MGFGEQPARAIVTPRVGDEFVQVAPGILDLLVNNPPTRVAIYVPRPRVGDLLPEFNNDTTLYDRTLIVEARAGKHHASDEWHESV